jgi:hypothetical protein
LEYACGEDLLTKDNLESIKTDMMQIEGKAILIADEYTLDNKIELAGIKITRNGDVYEIAEGDFVLSSQIQEVLKANDTENTDKKTKKVTYEALYYIWTQEDLNARGIGSIQVNNEDFYIIDYKGPKVYYSLGYEGTYDLTSLKDKEV